jgi:hypothetical protein
MSFEDDEYQSEYRAAGGAWVVGRRYSQHKIPTGYPGRVTSPDYLLVDPSRPGRTWTLSTAPRVSWV